MREVLHRTVQSEDPYRSLVETLPMVTYVEDAKARGRTLYISPQMEALLGYPLERWLTEEDFFFAVLHSEDRARKRAQREHTEPDSSSDTFRVVGSDGAVHWVRSDRVLVRGDDGQPLYIQGFWVDITERKALEEQLRQAQKMDAVGRLAGGIAHDFNNLLTAIIGHTTLALDQVNGGSAQLREQLRQVHDAAGRAAALTQELLAFSRRQKLELRVLDVAETIASTGALLARLIGEHVTMSMEIADGLDRVYADPHRLGQVLMNLAVNARDAMPRGGDLTIEAANCELDAAGASALGLEPGRYVRMTVSDTGDGMDDETKSQLFEPFFTTKDVGKGTGLGLATVYGIVAQSGGAISVDSTVGAGTAFSVYLPSTCDPAAADDVEPRSSRGRGDGELILLVEDEPSVRKVTQQALERDGYRVLGAPDPESALKLAARQTFDLLLTDVVMPQMSGEELAARLSDMHPGLDVVFMSGYAHEKLSPRSADATFLQKPFGLDDLCATVREVLDAASR